MTTFENTGSSPQPYTVPAGILGLKIEAFGPKGDNNGEAGGKGGYATGFLTVTPGQVIYVTASNGNPTGTADVRVGGQGLSDRALVAGSGGGQGIYSNYRPRPGNDGGGLVGGGLGGTQTAGGPAGAPSIGSQGDTGEYGRPGEFGVGGQARLYAGDGGAGWYGGGSGGNRTGGTGVPQGHPGGGGSSYIGGVIEASTIAGVNDGPAKVVITIADAQPNAPTLTSLADGAPVDRASVNRARHIFDDPIPTDSQSAFDLRYRIAGAATWTTVYKKSPNPWYDFSPDSLAYGDFERQVRTYDARGNQSLWSASGFFSVVEGPGGPAITEPVNGSTVEQTSLVVWSSPVQTDYQVRRVADDGAGVPVEVTIYFDTGTVTDNATRSLPLTFATNNRAEHVQVRVRNNDVWSPWSSVSVLASYSPPAVPAFVLRPDAGAASLLIEITNPTPVDDQPAAIFNDVYIDDGDGFQRRARVLPTNTPWTYRLPRSGRNYTDSIRIYATAANGVTAAPGEE